MDGVDDQKPVIRELIECIATAAAPSFLGSGGGLHFSSPSQVFINHSGAGKKGRGRVHQSVWCCQDVVAINRKTPARRAGIH